MVVVDHHNFHITKTGSVIGIKNVESLKDKKENKLFSFVTKVRFKSIMKTIELRKTPYLSKIQLSIHPAKYARVLEMYMLYSPTVMLTNVLL